MDGINRAVYRERRRHGAIPMLPCHIHTLGGANGKKARIDVQAD